MSDSTDNPLPLPDAPVVDGYRVIRQIGQGGMATVYLALQTSLDRRVAIKQMLPLASADELQARRFEHEARTIARLEHPHIVNIHEVGRTASGRLYYVMAFLPRGDLSHRDLSNDQPGVIRILRALLDALAYAHARGVVHRDVKAENVLFDDNDSPMLADFGIALSPRVTTRLTHAGMTLGSGGYMAPEQSRGERVDARADLYSLGVLAYEMLVGELPFEAADPLALAMKHGLDPIPRLPRTLGHWQAFIDRAMAKRPEKRFRNAQSMRAALDVIEKQINDPRMRLADAVYWFRRHPLWRSRRLHAVFAVVLLGAAATLVWQRSSPPIPPLVITPAVDSSPGQVDAADDDANSTSRQADPTALSRWVEQLRGNPQDPQARDGVAAHMRWLATQSTLDFADGNDASVSRRYAEAQSLQTASNDVLNDEIADFRRRLRRQLESEQRRAIAGADPVRSERARQLLETLGLGGVLSLPQSPDGRGVADDSVDQTPTGNEVKASGTQKAPRIRQLVSRAEYAQFVEETGRADSRCRNRLSPLRIFDRRSWNQPGFAQKPTDPVVCVSSADASAYLRWAGRRDGVSYRLPTADERPQNDHGLAEWTNACISGDSAGSPCSRRVAAGPLAQRQQLDTSRGYDDVGFRYVRE